MPTVAVQAPPRETPECPKCKNRDGIRDGGPSLSGFRAYDILTDSFGLLRCPKCKFRAGWAAFHKPSDQPSAISRQSRELKADR